MHTVPPNVITSTYKARDLFASDSEALVVSQGNEEDPSQALHSENMYKFGFPTQIIDLINAFPFNAVETDQNTGLIISEYLPDHAKAFQLALVYFEHAGCM